MADFHWLQCGLGTYSLVCCTLHAGKWFSRDAVGLGDGGKGVPSPAQVQLRSKPIEHVESGRGSDGCIQRERRIRLLVTGGLYYKVREGMRRGKTLIPV